MNNVNLVYFSATGTTKNVAASFAKGLQADIVEYDLLRQPPKQLISVDVETPAIFAMPVYAGRIPAICVDMLKHFRGMNTPAVAIVVYGNREYDDALLELKDLLNENGFVVIAAAAFIAQHSVFPAVANGRPDEKDKQFISTFSEKCRSALKQHTGKAKIDVKGKFPYCKPVAIPIRPSGNSRCNACGACVKICPTSAIAAGKPRKTDKTRCISCAACAAACPQKARNFHGLLYAVAGKMFVKKNLPRKEPDIFYAI